MTEENKKQLTLEEKADSTAGGFSLGLAIGATGTILLYKLLHDNYNTNLERYMAAVISGSAASLGYSISFLLRRR